MKPCIEKRAKWREAWAS